MSRLIENRDALLKAAKEEENKDKMAIEMGADRPGTEARDAYSDAAELVNWFCGSGLIEAQILKIAEALQEPKPEPEPKPKAKAKKAPKK